MMHNGKDERTHVPVSAPDARRPWQTPAVITSDAKGAGAQVSFGTDGSTPVYGPYGS